MITHCYLIEVMNEETKSVGDARFLCWCMNNKSPVSVDRNLFYSYSEILKFKDQVTFTFSFHLINQLSWLNGYLKLIFFFFKKIQMRIALDYLRANVMNYWPNNQNNDRSLSKFGRRGTLGLGTLLASPFPTYGPKCSRCHAVF